MRPTPNTAWGFTVGLALACLVDVPAATAAPRTRRPPEGTRSRTAPAAPKPVPPASGAPAATSPAATSPAATSPAATSPAPVAPASGVAPAAATEASAQSGPGSSATAPGALLEQAAAAYRALDFETGLAQAEQALGHPAVTDAERVRGYTLVAALYAIMDQSVEAERPYRLLLRLQSDFDLPADTPPKILAVFRKVQAEEREIQRAVREAERRAIMQALQARVVVASKAVGGQALPVGVLVTDPRRGVTSVVLEYRMRPDGPYAALPMERARADNWSTMLAEGQTASDSDRTMQFRVLLKDADGVLMKLGTDEEPLTVRIAAGGLGGEPFWKQRRFYAVAAVGVTALAAGGGALGLVVLAGAVASAFGTYLVLRGDGVPQTSAGRQTL